MKKIFLAMMAIAAIALTGCKQEEPKPKDPGHETQEDMVQVYFYFIVDSNPLVGHEKITNDLRDKIRQDLYGSVEKTIWLEQQWLGLDTVLVLDETVKKIERVVAKYSNGLFNGKVRFDITRRNNSPILIYTYREFAITPADEVYEYNYANILGDGAKVFGSAVDRWVYKFDTDNPMQSLKDTATIYEAMNALVAQYRHQQLDGTFVVELKSREKGAMWHREWNEVSHPSYNVGYISSTFKMPGFEQVWASVVKDYEYLRENTEPSDNKDSINAIIANWVKEKNLDNKFVFASFEQVVSYDNWEQVHNSIYGSVTVHIGSDANGIETQYIKGEDKDVLILALQTAMVDWHKSGLCYGQLEAFTKAVKDVCRNYPKTEGKVYIEGVRSDTKTSFEHVATILLPVE